MPETATALQAVDQRHVLTYQPTGWPEGVLTGFVNDAGGRALITNKPGVL